jgi:type VI secretion system protein VasD
VIAPRLLRVRRRDSSFVMSELERTGGRRCFVLVYLACVSVCSGCGLWASKVTPPCTLPARVRLEASERINPDAHGAALPTVVRVYQLQAVGRIEQSDFAAVWRTPAPVLGPDLVAARELTLFPGQSASLDVRLAPQVRFVVAVAIFRRPTATQWRSIIPLPESSRLCTAYLKQGAPDPAFTFRFDQYRAEGRSSLLAAHGALEHDLPEDVAPSADAREEQP